MYFKDHEIAEFESMIDRLVDVVQLRESIPLTLDEADDPDRDSFGQENIVGFGFGEKESGGRLQGIPAICAFVVRKVEPRRVRPGWLIEELVQQQLGPYLLSDVVEVGRPRAFHHERKPYAPRIPGGVCIDDGSGATSTLGAWVTDGVDKHLLTCWHSIDRGHASSSTGILHPKGRAQIATFTASVHPELDWRPGQVTVDAALGLADPTTDPGDFVLSIGEIHDVKTVKATGQAVRKSGVTTHVTNGTVRNLRGSLKLDLPQNTVISANPWLYERQMIVAPDRVADFSKDGDSGSIVMTDDGYAIGLLVGGGLDTQVLSPFSVVTPIGEVLDRLRGKLNPRPSKLELICYP